MMRLNHVCFNFYTLKKNAVISHWSARRGLRLSKQCLKSALQMAKKVQEFPEIQREEISVKLHVSNQFQQLFSFFSLMVASLFKRKRSVRFFWHLQFEIHVSVTFLWLFSRVHYYCLKNMSSQDNRIFKLFKVLCSEELRVLGTPWNSLDARFKLCIQARCLHFKDIFFKKYLNIVFRTEEWRSLENL